MASIPLNLAQPNVVETQADVYSFGERFEAAFDLGQKDTFISRYMQTDILEDLEQKDPFGKVDATELNKTFKDVEVPFDKPTSFLVANEINEAAKEKKRLYNIASNNNKEGAVGITLTAGILAHATDPIEAGVDVLLGLSTAGVGSMLSTAAKAGKFGQRSASILAMTKKANDARTLTKNIAEGVAANAALEPFFYGTSKTMQEKYEAQDAAISVIGGGVVFPAAAFGVGKAYRGIRNNAEWTGQAIKGVMSQIAAGKRPDLSIISKVRENHFTAKTMIPPESLRAKYKFSDLTPDEILNRPMYMTLDTQGDLTMSNHRVHYSAQYLGEDGIHITDNPIEAERTATDPLMETGQVVQVNLKSSNFLNSDQPTRELGYIRDALSEDIYKEAFDEAETLTQAFKDITDLAEMNGHDVRGILAAMHTAIKSKGHEGVHYKEPDSSNHVYVYDESMAEVKDTFIPKQEEQPKPDTATANESASTLLNNKERDIFFNKNIQKEIDEFTNIDELSIRRNKEEFDQYMNDLKESIDNGVASKEDQDICAMLETESKLDVAEDSTFKKLLNCIIRFGK